MHFHLVASSILLWTIYANNTVGETFIDAQNLHTTLMTNYTKEIRPSLDQTHPTLVQVAFYLASIIEFEEKTNKFVFSGAFQLIWQDHRMMWNKDDYGGADDILIPHSKVWIPDLGLINPHSAYHLLSSSETKVRYSNDGVAFWRPADVFTVTCAADVSYYPFDTQVCQGVFGPVFHHTQEVYITPQSEIDRSVFIPSGIWTLKTANLSSEINEEIAHKFIAVSLTLQRQSKFYVITLVMPILIVGLSNVLVFLIPPDSGERIGFSVTILLAMTVFMTIVSDVLPTNSLPDVSYLCISIFIDLCVSAMLTGLAITSTRLHQRVDKNIPKWLKRLTVSCLCDCYKQQRFSLGRKSQLHGQSIGEEPNQFPRRFSETYNYTEKSNGGFYNRTGRAIAMGGLPRIYVGTQHHEYDSDINRRGFSYEHHKKSCASDVAWSQVARFLDFVFFLFFGVLLIVKLIVLSLVYGYKILQ